MVLPNVRAISIGHVVSKVGPMNLIVRGLRHATSPSLVYGELLGKLHRASLVLMSLVRLRVYKLAFMLYQNL